MALLLPAVNSARDAMRRMQCKNNLAQIGRGCQAHLAAQGHFPSSGWGWLWVGDPDRGFGAKQPGGWIYNMLPYVGLSMIHDIGKGLLGDFDAKNPNSKYCKLAEAQSAVIPFLICPSRRRAVATPPATDQANLEYNCLLPPAGSPFYLHSKTDYAANGGSVPFNGTGPPPSDNCFAKYPNCAWSNPDDALAAFDGISGERSEVTAGAVTDGLSNVFLAGEKYLSPDYYYTGTAAEDNNTIMIGNDWDLDRWVNVQPMRDTRGIGGAGSFNFGSPHYQGCHFVFCDGSVKMISYQIDPKTYKSLGVRNDGTYSENY